MAPKRASFAAITVSLALASFMGRLDTYIVSISLPAMASYFQADLAEIGYVMLAYVLAIAGFVLLAGGLGDRFGYRRTLLAGYVFFTASSLACGAATEVRWLVVARSFQGLGGALLVTMAYAIIPRRYPSDRVGATMGMLNMAGSLGILFGSPLGGMLTGWLSWRFIFFVNVPVGIAAIYLALRSIPDDEPAEEKDFDWPGCLLSAAGLCLLVLALGQLSSPRGIRTGTVSLLAGASLLGVLLAWEKRNPRPFLDMTLFGDRAFSLGLLSNLSAFTQISAHGFLIPFYLERICGLDSEQSGAVVAVFCVSTLAAAPVAGRLADREPPHRIAALAMSSGALACAFFAATLSRGGWWPVIVYLVWMGLSFGAFLAPNAKLVLSRAKRNRQGVASSVFLSGGNVGLAMGIALATLLFHLALPSGVALDAPMAENGLPAEGFRNAYLFGAACCLTAALCALYAGTTLSGKDRKA